MLVWLWRFRHPKVVKYRLSLVTRLCRHAYYVTLDFYNAQALKYSKANILETNYGFDLIPTRPKYVRFGISYKLWLFFCKIKRRSLVLRPIAEQHRPSCVNELWDHEQTPSSVDRKWSSRTCSEWAPFLLMSKLSWVSPEQEHRKRALN